MNNRFFFTATSNHSKLAINKLLTLLLFSFCLLQSPSLLANPVTQNDVQSVQVNLGKQYSFHSKHLSQSRDFFVRLPEGYQDTKRNYPVIYLLDANNETLTYMKDLYFHSVNQIERLMARGDIPQSIIVGLPFASSQWYSNVVGNTEPFYQYLTEELITHIDENYRTSSNRILVGQSYSAVFVINALTKQPEAFSNYVAIEPVLASGQLEHAISNYQDLKTANTALQLIMGGVIMLHEVETLNAAIYQANIKGLEVNLETFPSESHSSVYYPALNSAVRGHFSDYRQPSEKMILSSNMGYQDLVEYYQNRLTKYEVKATERELQRAIFDVIFINLLAKKFDQAFALWPKWNSPHKLYNANRIIADLMRNDELDSAITMLQHLAKAMPASVSILDRLANVYQQNQQLDKANEYREKLKQLLTETLSAPVDTQTEASLNRYGYRLLHEKRNDEALVVFKGITESRPESINALDSLSDAYMALNDYRSAIIAIEKAITLAKAKEVTDISSLTQKLEQLKKRQAS